MKNASSGRVSSPSYKSISSMFNPSGRTSVVAGPVDMTTNSKMCNKSVRHDAVSGVARSTKY